MAFQHQGPSWPPLPCQRSPANAHLPHTSPGETVSGLPQPRSFAAAIAQPRMLSRFPPIILAPRQVGSKEGFPAVSFSAEEVKAGAKRFEFSLVAKFSIGRPPLADIQKSFQAAWKINGRATISEVWDSRHILVILDSEQDVTTALASPGRKIGHSLFRLFRWSTDYNPRKESSTTTIWIRLPGLPISLYDRAYIEPIVSGLGRFVDVDQRTKACLSLRFARVCVELDVSKVIPHKIWVNLPNNQGFWQEVKIESKLAYCARCMIHGHDLSICRKEAARKEKGATEEGQKDSNNTNLQENNMTKSSTIQEGRVTKDDNNISIASKIGMNDLVREQEWQVVNRKKKGKGQREDVVRHVQGKGGNVCIVEHINPTSAVVVFKESNQEQEDDVICPMVIINSQDDKSMDPDTAMVASSNQSDTNRTDGGNTPSQIQDGDEESIDHASAMILYNEQEDNIVLPDLYLTNVGGKFYCEELGGKIFQDQEEFAKFAEDNGYVQEDSTIPIEESEYEVPEGIHNSTNQTCDQVEYVDPSPMTRTRQRKKKGHRSSARSCPKKKDKNFVYS